MAFCLANAIHKGLNTTVQSTLQLTKSVCYPRLWTLTNDDGVQDISQCISVVVLLTSNFTVLIYHTCLIFNSQIPASLDLCLKRSGNIQSSSVVTFAHLPICSSSKITNRCFRRASPLLWNQLPHSSCQPLEIQSHSPLPPFTHASSSSSLSPLTSSITPVLFHSTLKTYMFHKSFPPQNFPTCHTEFTDLYQ